MNAIERFERFKRIRGNEVFKCFRSNLEEARYNYWNSNGAIQKHRRMMDTLFQAVDAGVVNSGWLLSCGVDYHYEKIAKLAMMQRARGWDVRYHTNCILETIEDAYTRLGQVIMGERDKAGKEVK